MSSLFDHLPHETGRAELLGASVCWRRLGVQGGTPLLLLHGGRAHGGWWAPVAALLADRFDIVVPDLSGFGDSGHRRSYSVEGWARELAALVQLLDLAEPVVVVGHSMGGKVGLYLATESPQMVAALVFVDTNLRPPAAGGPGRSAVPARRTRIYPTVAEAIERFRLDPPGSAADDDLLARLARQSLRAVPHGWTWKFDPAARGHVADDQIEHRLDLVGCRVGLIRGSESPLTSGRTEAYLTSRLGRAVPTVTIPNAWHHVPLDAPSECADAVSRLASPGV